jgi:RHH-type transcriptional regulator, proline utilization regulon repressor / proline dehydrogenase / delta 1-pyrroline-5-carboxylate dehydrogenase
VLRLDAEGLHRFLYHVSAQVTVDENEHARRLAAYLDGQGFDHDKISARAVEHILRVRGEKQEHGIEVFFQEYGLSTKEGLAIMELAEALVRIPDAATANELLHDKLHGTNWKPHLGKHKSPIINASAFGLQVVKQLSHFGAMVQKLTDPVVREAIKHSIRYLSDHFVLGQTTTQALERSKDSINKGYIFSYDQLGEGARSSDQAEHYLKNYLDLLDALHGVKDAAMSVKLSALCPQLNWLKKDAALTQLLPVLRQLVTKAKKYDIPITLDAEEIARHDLMLLIFEQLFTDPVCDGYQGLGLAVQAYHKQAFDTITWLIGMADCYKKRIPVRLVKGAYWDAEIKQAQVDGLPYYPVFTKKSYTDVSYIACAAQLLAHPEQIFPQFATHNAYTIAAIELLGAGKTFEFQLLFGMGQALYDYIVAYHNCRIYAPIGLYKELLPYLIRRLIENGASNSFIRGLGDDSVPLSHLVSNPCASVMGSKDGIKEKDIPMPTEIYPGRENSSAIAFGNRRQVDELWDKVKSYFNRHYEAYSIINGKRFVVTKNITTKVSIPYAPDRQIGLVLPLSAEDHPKLVEAAGYFTARGQRDRN